MAITERILYFIAALAILSTSLPYFSRRHYNYARTYSQGVLGGFAVGVFIALWLT